MVKLTREVFRLGITLAKVKLKGIDGDPHKRWSMWFNSTTRKTLPGFEIISKLLEREASFGMELQVVHGCRQLVL